MKFNNYKPYLMAIIVLLGLATFAFADTIKLLSGRIIEGVIIEKDDQFVKIKQGDKLLTIPVKMIDDGTKKKRYLKRLISNKANDSTSMSIRERLRAIREAEYQEKEGLRKKEVENKEKVEAEKRKLDKKSHDEQLKAEYSKAGEQCPIMDKFILSCSPVLFKQKHPTQEFVVRHFFKGFYSNDGSQNKCHYEQSIPGEPGDVIDCSFDAYDRKQFLNSVANGESPVFSENKFLQKALEEGICIKVNHPQI